MLFLAAFQDRAIKSWGPHTKKMSTGSHFASTIRVHTDLGWKRFVQLSVIQDYCDAALMTLYHGKALSANHGKASSQVCKTPFAPRLRIP